MLQKALAPTFLFVALTFTALAPAAQAAEDLFSRIEVGCRKEIGNDVSNTKSVCACVKRNFKASAEAFSGDELDKIASAYGQSKEAEEDLQDDKYSDVVLFDYDVTQGCMKSPGSFLYKK